MVPDILIQDPCISERVNRERLLAESRPRHVDQMAMMSEDHDLPAFGKSRQRAQDVCRAFVVRGDEHIIENEQHVLV